MSCIPLIISFLLFNRCENLHIVTLIAVSSVHICTIILDILNRQFYNGIQALENAMSFSDFISMSKAKVGEKTKQDINNIFRS